MTKHILATAFLIVPLVFPAAKPPDPYAGWAICQFNDDQGKPISICLPLGFKGGQLRWTSKQLAAAGGYFPAGAAEYSNGRASILLIAQTPSPKDSENGPLYTSHTAVIGKRVEVYEIAISDKFGSDRLFVRCGGQNEHHTLEIADLICRWYVLRNR